MKTEDMAQEPKRLCRDCAHRVGELNLIRWQCNRNVYAVTGEFVSCDDERTGSGVVLPPRDWDSKKQWRCVRAGLLWEPIQ